MRRFFKEFAIFSDGQNFGFQNKIRRIIFDVFLLISRLPSRGYHHYKVITWPDIYDGEKLTIHREANDESLQHDRYACAVKRIKAGRGLLVAQLVTVGRVPLEVSKLCY